MGSVKRAWLYLARKRARSILLFSILFTAGFLMLVGWSIRASAVAAAAQVRESVSTGWVIEQRPIPGEQLFELSVNADGQTVRTAKVPMLTPTKLARTLAIEGVSGYFVDRGMDAAFTGLELEPGGCTQALAEMSEQRREDAEPEAQYRAANATCAQANGFYPVDESVWHPFFVSGALELVAGRHITAGDQGKAVVSDELASRNRLRLGDTITARRFDFVTGEQFGVTLETEIVGIFSLAFRQDLSDWTSEYDILTNIVFADAGMRDWAQVQWNTHYGNAVLAAQPDREVSPATVYVRDPQQLNAIAEQLTALPDVDWSLYTLTRDDRDYQAAAGPLLAMETLATATAVVTVVGTLAALSLIWTMWIRGRRREIGILTAIGLRRRAVVGQFVLECGLLTVAAFLVASLAAGWATGPIGASVETLLAPEGGTEAFVATVDANLDLSVSRAPTRLEPLDYGLAPATSLLGFASLALTALSAVVIASMRILKLRPRDILSAR